MRLNALVMQMKREYWEYRRLFVVAPMLIMLLITGLECWAIMSDPLLGVKNSFFSNQAKDFFINDTAMESVRVNFDKPGVLAFIVGLQQFINWWFFALVATVLALQYCQSALFHDRKSREILFWRSMPVSETTNVLIKLLVAAAGIPLMLLLMSLVSTLVSLLVISIWMKSPEQFLFALQNAYGMLDYFQGSLILILLVLPLLAWTLLVSAFVKRNPQLFAWVIPFFLWLSDRFLHKFFTINLHLHDVMKPYLDYARSVFMVTVDAHQHDVRFSFDLDWYPSLVMLSIVGVFLAVTIWLRNHRYEIQD